MVRIAGGIALVATLLAGCAATPSSQVRSFSARDLGVDEYLPGGSLEIREVSPDVYDARFRILKENFKSSGQDGMLLTVIMGMITGCPAWMLAKEKGAEAAVITREISVEGGFRFSIFLTTAQEVKAKAGQVSGGAEAADFTDPFWRSAAANGACPVTAPPSR